MYISKLVGRELIAEGSLALHFERPRAFSFKSGQAIDLTLIHPPETDDEGNTRTFSLVSTPTENRLTVATRMRDTAFKRVMKDASLGTDVKIDGPMGSFTLHNDISKTAVFLAGGIGVTPFVSMIKDASANKSSHRLYLFYSNRRVEDAPFLEMLQHCEESNKNFRLIATMTGMEKSHAQWCGETGYINQQMLRKHLDRINGPIYYIAGPPAMLRAMRQTLSTARIDEDDVRTEEFAGGSNLNVAYTWSKAMSYADNEDLGGLAFPYPAFWRKNYAPAGFDRTNNLEISGVMALPFGKGEPWLQSGFAGSILGGWLINPVISVMSGVPFTVGAGGNLNANGSGQTADLVAPFRLTHGKPPRTGVTCALGDPTCEYFAPSSFAAPLITSAATAHYGNTNRDEFRGPGYVSVDLSAVRDFKVREWATLEVRADAIGLTNTPHFGNPNTSCPASATTPDPVTGSGQLCNTGTNNNFGVITGVAQPGGFFGPDPGNRVVWLGAQVIF